MINYQYLADAQFYYKGLAYSPVEVPWWTSLEVNHITKPEAVRHIPDYYLPLNDKVLVASAEQSFLALAKEGKLPLGRLQATTPCFRNELNEDALHKQYFMKTELIRTRNVDDIALESMISDALGFFELVVPDPYGLAVVKTPDGFDIEYKGVELGSYGIRSCPFLDWVFGTGVAEPRLSTAIQMGRNNK